jgi:hypothetical protein
MKNDTWSFFCVKHTHTIVKIHFITKKMKRAHDESSSTDQMKMLLRKGNDGSSLSVTPSTIRPMTPDEELCHSALLMVMEHEVLKIPENDYRDPTRYELFMKISECFPRLSGMAVRTSIHSIHCYQNKIQNLKKEHNFVYIALVDACITCECKKTHAHLEFGSISNVLCHYADTIDLENMHSLLVRINAFTTNVIPYAFAGTYTKRLYLLVTIAHGSKLEFEMVIKNFFDNVLYETMAGPAFELACSLQPGNEPLVLTVYQCAKNSLSEYMIDRAIAILCANAYLTKNKEEITTVNSMLTALMTDGMNVGRFHASLCHNQLRHMIYYTPCERIQVHYSNKRGYICQQRDFGLETIQNKKPSKTFPFLESDHTFIDALFHADEHRVITILCLMASEGLISFDNAWVGELHKSKALIRLFMLKKNEAATQLAKYILVGNNNQKDIISHFICTIDDLIPEYVSDAIGFLLSLPFLHKNSVLYTIHDCTERSNILEQLALRLVTIDFRNKETGPTTIHAYIDCISCSISSTKKKGIITALIKALCKAGFETNVCNYKHLKDMHDDELKGDSDAPHALQNEEIVFVLTELKDLLLTFVQN